MKRYVCLILMMLITGLHAFAQHVATADNITILHAGDSVYVEFDLLRGSEKLPRDSKLTITPIITKGSYSVATPHVGIYGHTAYLTVIRSGQRVATNEAMTICYKEMDQPLHFVGAAPYQVWMDGAQVLLVTVESDHCGRELGRQELAVSYPEGTLAPPLRYEPQPQPAARPPYDVVDTARIEFPKNVVEVQPDWSDNQRQLARIEQILRNIADQQADLKDVQLKGFASPEGPFKHNQWLALNRAESLKQYLIDHFDISADSIVTSWTAEDWDGLIKYVADASFSDRQVILEILESDLPQKERLRIIRTQYPEAYRQLVNDCLPYLRYVDATFRYTVTPAPVIAPHAPTVPVAAPQRPMPSGFAAGIAPTPYTPWFALKTNLLFDIALALNFEVEVPIGRQNRWSVMYEQWFPWYVWRHNSNAYEILVCGLEGRYWLGQCRDAVPTLSGGFLGLYGALGKSDIEWKSTGDQMEFQSVGFSVGYSWPLSKHWNLEASASVGLLWGKRHHYNGRFGDTHLIWSYDTNDTYFGPTKAKVSLVWLLGPKKKGGAR